jgi:RsmE family RNA methyltransferase
LLLAVGPEGGWTAYELDLLTRHGFTPVSMGWRRLRSDTACVALLALAHARLEREGESDGTAHGG